MAVLLIPLEQSDSEISIAREMHDEPTIAKYISISDNYFDYVTHSPNVVYTKIKIDNQLGFIVKL